MARVDELLRKICEGEVKVYMNENEKYLLAEELRKYGLVEQTFEGGIVYKYNATPEGRNVLLRGGLSHVLEMQRKQEENLEASTKELKAQDQRSKDEASDRSLSNYLQTGSLAGGLLQFLRGLLT